MIRVLVVDDSALTRKQLHIILQSDPELQVVSEARNGEEAIALTKQFKPDVITMDIRMPKMDGLDAIRHIMAECPTPIVVVTAADPDRDSELLAQATRFGAMVTILKRSARNGASQGQTLAGQLVRQVKLMSQVKVITRPLNRHRIAPGAESQQPTTPGPLLSTSGRDVKVIAIGSSTGGPAALYKILDGLPADFATPIVIVQHISFGFVEGLAGWLDGGCQLRVKVAEHGERLQPGHVLVAPDDRHVVVDSFGRVRLREMEPVSGHRPSATVLFESVAQAYGPAATGVILTGMGRDGAVGMKALKESGALTIAQDEASCVVFGMPKEAIALGAVIHIVPLEKIAPKIVSLCSVGSYGHRLIQKV